MPTVLPPAIAGTWRDRVFVTQEWPLGFCPEHVFTELRCNLACVETRVAFAEAAYELRDYWQDLQHRIDRLAS